MIKSPPPKKKSQKSFVLTQNPLFFPTFNIEHLFLRARGIIIAWVQVHVPSVLLPRCLLKRGLLRRCSHPSQTSKGQPSRWWDQSEGGGKWRSRAVCTTTKEKVTAVNKFSSPCGVVFLGETPVFSPQMYRDYLCKSFVKYILQCCPISSAIFF